MSALRFFLLFALVLSFGAAPAHAEKRVALVVGNSAYQNTPALPNPRNDAKAVGAALQKLGFDVDIQTDLTKADFDRVLRSFGDRLDGAQVALFFYAGHGLQVSGVNYLVPVDARISRERDLLFETVEVATVLRQMEEEKRVNLIFLDACRDNPLGRSLGGSGRSVAVGRGLSAIPAAATGTLISFATKDGNTAEDGTGGNSPYTTALLKHIATPGLDVGIMLRRVREEVLTSTNNRQIPWEYGSLLGEFQMAPAAAAPPAPAPVPAAEAAKPVTVMNSVDPRALELAIWDSIKGSNNAALYEDYLRQFPQGTFAVIARVRLEELRATRAASLPPVPNPAPNANVPTAVLNPLPTAPTPPRPPAGSTAETLRDCPQCPLLVTIPAGSFTMGSPGDEAERRADEGPQHRVSIPRPLAVGKFPVTFAEWDACTAEGGCNAYKPKDAGWGREAQPVIYVSWEDAQNYVAWLSRKTGKAYRLLTEAEWEYAARAGTTGPFHTGATITSDKANFDGGIPYPGTAKGAYRARTTQVDLYAANGFGLHDMGGNVWQWVADCYKPSYDGAPTNGTARADMPCDSRVMRGSSWYGPARNLRSAMRGSNLTTIRNDRVGFRVVRGAAN